MPRPAIWRCSTMLASMSTVWAGRNTPTRRPYRARTVFGRRSRFSRMLANAVWRASMSTLRFVEVGVGFRAHYDTADSGSCPSPCRRTSRPTGSCRQGASGRGSSTGRRAPRSGPGCRPPMARSRGAPAPRRARSTASRRGTLTPRLRSRIGATAMASRVSCSDRTRASPPESTPARTTRTRRGRCQRSASTSSRRPLRTRPSGSERICTSITQKPGYSSGQEGGDEAYTTAGIAPSDQPGDQDDPEAEDQSGHLVRPHRAPTGLADQRQQRDPPGWVVSRLRPRRCSGPTCTRGRPPAAALTRDSRSRRRRPRRAPHRRDRRIGWRRRGRRRMRCRARSGRGDSQTTRSPTLHQGVGHGRAQRSQRSCSMPTPVPLMSPVPPVSPLLGLPA